MWEGNYLFWLSCLPTFCCSLNNKYKKELLIRSNFLDNLRLTTLIKFIVIFLLSNSVLPNNNKSIENKDLAKIEDLGSILFSWLWPWSRWEIIIILAGQQLLSMNRIIKFYSNTQTKEQRKGGKQLKERRVNCNEEIMGMLRSEVSLQVMT